MLIAEPCVNAELSS